MNTIAFAKNKLQIGGQVGVVSARTSSASLSLLEINSSCNSSIVRVALVSGLTGVCTGLLMLDKDDRKPKLKEADDGILDFGGCKLNAPAHIYTHTNV